MSAKIRRSRDFRTRQTLMGLLKQAGPSDAESLARRLKVSSMAVRQHLYTLQAQKLVSFEERHGPVGRPSKIWMLTPAADRYFPNGHAELAVGLLSALNDALRERGLSRVLAARARHQVEVYRRSVPASGPLAKRLEALATVRTEEGYMAEVTREADGGLVLIENHCPICDAASACAGLCGSELEVFRKVLGPRCSVERTEHILTGARRCVYRVRETPRTRASR